MYCSLQGSSVHGILQARVLEWQGASEKSGILWTWEALSELHWVWCNGKGSHLELRQEPQGSAPDFLERTRKEKTMPAPGVSPPAVPGFRAWEDGAPRGLGTQVRTRGRRRKAGVSPSDPAGEGNATQGNRLSFRDQEGRRGSEEAVPGPSVFPSGEPGVSGDSCCSLCDALQPYGL